MEGEGGEEGRREEGGEEGERRERRREGGGRRGVKGGGRGARQVVNGSERLQASVTTHK